MTTDTPRTDQVYALIREPKNWDHAVWTWAEKLERTLSERDSQLRECVELLERLEEPQELNPSNYDHEQVCELNAKMVELCLASRALLARFKESKTL